LVNPRPKGLNSPFLILDRNFGSGRGTPIDRKLIMDFLAEETADLDSSLKVLEFGDKIFSEIYLAKSDHYQFNFLEGQFPIESHDQKEVVGDLTRRSETPPQFDLIIATQLLGFTRNPFIAATGLIDLLSPGGLIIGTEPFCSPISKYDDERWGDYFRFTSKGVLNVFSDDRIDEIRVTPLGNWETSLSIYKGFCLEDNLQLSPISDPSYATNIGYVVRRNKNV
jgi:hypothetical protein